MNSKGDFIISKEMSKMIFYAFLIIIVSLVIVSVFGVAVSKEVKTSELEQHIALTRLLSSNDCLAYSNGGRNFPGVVDLNKLDSSLSDCINYEDRGGQGIMLSLFDLEENLLGEVEINKLVFAQHPTCGLKDANVDCYSTRKYVLYRDGETMNGGILDVWVVTNLE